MRPSVPLADPAALRLPAPLLALLLPWLLALPGCATGRGGEGGDGGQAGDVGGDAAGAVVAEGATLDGEEIRQRTATRPEELLIGRFPGVRVFRQPGGGLSVRVWGPGLQSGGEPLYVVDGMPVRVEPGRGLDWLNPSDIQRIEVLKDISETAFWGVRGANGVVLITTRRGSDPPGRG